MQKIIKAEILFTRRCNLACSYCGMVQKGIPEIGITEWQKGIDAIKNLGATFMAIYGAEPTVRFDDLLTFIKYADMKGMNTTLITNGLLLDDQKMEDLYKYGLRSITVSFDGFHFSKFADQDTKRKAEASEKVIKFFQQKQMRDIEVVVTVGRHNYEDLPRIISHFSEQGIWTHFDLVHPDRHQEGSKCEGDCRDIVFRQEDMKRLNDVIDYVESMKIDGALIHPSQWVISMWNQFKNVGVYGWKCSKVSWITVDCDGSVFPCDDYQPQDMRGKFMVWDIDKKFEEFRKESQMYLKYCPGCFWGTHVMSEEMVGTNYGDNYFAHTLKEK